MSIQWWLLLCSQQAEGRLDIGWSMGQSSAIKGNDVQLEQCQPWIPPKNKGVDESELDISENSDRLSAIQPEWTLESTISSCMQTNADNVDAFGM